MNTLSRIIASTALLLSLTLALAGCATHAPRVERELAVQQVTAAEQAFARSMAERDLSAFATHVDDEAVFFSGKKVLRGKAAVVATWKGLFDGPKAPFSWQPEQVEVLASGDLALSTGPVLDADGKRFASFQSIWRRQPSGEWRIIFDRGCPCVK